MMVGITSDGTANSLSGSPHEVRRRTNVSGCAPATTTGDAPDSAVAWARLRALRLAVPAQGGGTVHLMALPAVVDESYSAFFTLT